MVGSTWEIFVRSWDMLRRKIGRSWERENSIERWEGQALRLEIHESARVKWFGAGEGLPGTSVYSVLEGSWSSAVNPTGKQLSIVHTLSQMILYVNTEWPSHLSRALNTRVACTRACRQASWVCSKNITPVVSKRDGWEAAQSPLR